MSRQVTARNTLLFTTAGLPTAADVVTTNGNVLVTPKAKTKEFKDSGNGSTGATRTVTISDWTTADFKVDLIARSSGALGVAPKYAELLKAAGLKETISAGVSVVYSPATTFVQGSAKAYLDGYMRDITGVAADFSFGGKVGEFVEFNFSLKGFTTLEEIAQANPTVTLDVNKKFIIESATVITVSGATINLESFDFSKGNDIQETYASAMKGFDIVEHKPTLKVTAVKTNGNNAHWSDFKENTRKAFVAVLGSEAGDKLTFSAPFCNPSDVGESDSSGKMVYEQTWLCEESVGNDNFSLIYE